MPVPSPAFGASLPPGMPMPLSVTRKSPIIARRPIVDHDRARPLIWECVLEGVDDKLGHYKTQAHGNVRFHGAVVDRHLDRQPVGRESPVR